MAITATALTSASNTTALGVYTTASIAPTANRLVLLTVVGFKSVSASAQPSVTGADMTWTPVSGFIFDSETTVTATTGRFDVFRALSASPGVGTVAVSYDANQSGCLWSIVEFDGIDISGTNGANAVAQPVQTTANPAAATSASLTLSAAGHSNNRPFSCWIHESSEITNPRTNWSELHDTTMTAPNTGLETQWRSDSFETTASASWNTSSLFGGIALELVAAAAGVTVPLAPALLTLMALAVTVVTSDESPRYTVVHDAGHHIQITDMQHSVAARKPS